MDKRTIKIGNAGGYWGDDPSALRRQIEGGRLDYVSMDFLAEITMSIMQKQKSREPKSGYARDFIAMATQVMAKALKDKTRIITNAGGVNPEACAEAVAYAAKQLGLNPKIAVVYGDDILADLDKLRGGGAKFANMETGEDFATIADRVLAANVYFGAAPVVAALATGADIVITGRVTDTGITLAPMVHEFGWSLQDWHKLAAGIVAGHMIECGCQVTGGNFTDWQQVKSFHNIGYPLVEMSDDGSFVLTKHTGTGGMVSVDTVREQLVYEMGNPQCYITPDVVADFSSIELRQDGPDRVHVSGVRGFEPTPFYKVSMAYQDGFKVVSSIIIAGPNARKKAETFADIFWRKCDLQLVAKETEYFGWNACQQSLTHVEDGAEIRLRLGARSANQNDLKVFTKLVPSLILSGPPGVAVTGGTNKPQEVVSYWPALMAKEAVHPRVATFTDGTLVDVGYKDNTARGTYQPKDAPELTQIAHKAVRDVRTTQQDFKNSVSLSQICLGRSGDKGDTCNIGVIARSPEAYAFLQEYLTAQRVKDWFQELCLGKVIRYRVDNLMALNFLLEEALGGGGTKTMRSDAQGKTFAQALIRQKVDIPAHVLASVKG